MLNFHGLVASVCRCGNGRGEIYFGPRLFCLLEVELLRPHKFVKSSLRRPPCSIVVVTIMVDGAYISFHKTSGLRNNAMRLVNEDVLNGLSRNAQNGVKIEQKHYSMTIPTCRLHVSDYAGMA